MYLTDEQLNILFHEVCAVIEGRQIAMEEEVPDLNMREIEQLAIIRDKIADEQWRRSTRRIAAKLDREIDRALATASDADSAHRSTIIAAIEKSVLDTEAVIGQKFSKWDRFRPTEKQQAQARPNPQILRI